MRAKKKKRTEQFCERRFITSSKNAISIRNFFNFASVRVGNREALPQNKFYKVTKPKSNIKSEVLQKRGSRTRGAPESVLGPKATRLASFNISLRALSKQPPDIRIFQSLQISPPFYMHRRTNSLRLLRGRISGAEQVSAGAPKPPLFLMKKKFMAFSQECRGN